MNDAGTLALFISLLAFFICTPTIAYCFCCTNARRQYRILPSTNVNTNANEYPEIA